MSRAQLLNEDRLPLKRLRSFFILGVDHVIDAYFRSSWFAVLLSVIFPELVARAGVIKLQLHEAEAFRRAVIAKLCSRRHWRINEHHEPVRGGALFSIRSSVGEEMVK